MNYISLLILISILIILFLFVMSSMLYKKNKSKEILNYEEIENFTVEKQREQIETFFKNEVTNFFKRYKMEYQNIDLNTNVSKLNKKYSEEILSLLNTLEIKTILNDVNSIYHLKSKNIEKISKESPFTWIKKFERELEELNESK